MEKNSRSKVPQEKHMKRRVSTVRNLQKVDMKPMGRIVKYFFVTRDYDGSVSLEPNPSTGIIEHDEYKWATIEELSDFRDSLVPVNIIRKALNLVRV